MHADVDKSDVPEFVRIHGKSHDKIILLVLERTSESSIRGWRGGLVS